MQRFLVLCWSCFTLLIGCQRNPLGTVDPQGTAPSVSAFTVSPPVIRIDTLPSANGVYAVTLAASVHATNADPSSGVAKVTVEALSPSGESFGKTDLHDDGIPPDNAAGDATFSGRLQLALSRADVGTYRILCTATSNNEMDGTSAIRSIRVFRRSSPPWLFALQAPDRVTIPVGGSTPFVLSVAVGDSDGLADVSDVTLRILNSSNPTSVNHLLDNGNGANGDNVAGDGRYSIILAPNSSNVGKTYMLAFQAKDRAGDTSATLIHPLVLQ